MNVEQVTLDELLAESDIISSHLPIKEDTLGFFDLSKFEKMQSQPLFINTSRGKVVKEDDLVEALERGMLKGAALDVLDQEPPSWSNKLLHLPNVIVTPHAGFLSETALLEVRKRTALNVYNFFEKNYVISVIVVNKFE